jgi:hypothetical protein
MLNLTASIFFGVFLQTVQALRVLISVASVHMLCFPLSSFKPSSASSLQILNSHLDKKILCLCMEANNLGIIDNK